ncbi:ubiquinol-cytochrome C chaperone-domain-containing protein [Tuber brumale]|nr:ubiquinol-cytochrome C chaperone-domain-containing protein [Tuber brumale]
MATRGICSAYLRLSSGRTAARRALLRSSPPTLASRLHTSQWRFQQTAAGNKEISNEEQIAPRVEGRPVRPGETKPSGGIFGKVAEKLREKMPNTTETYVAHGVTLELYNECLKQAAYAEGHELSESARFWYDVCDRPKTFMSWAQVTVLHMWMLIVRIRALELDRVKTWQQHFVDHFFYDAEGKMIHTYKITNGGQRKTYLKDLYSQYRGMIAGYDEGLCKGDAVLSAAIWRNVFDARPDVDMEALAMITSYVRRVVHGLDKVNDQVLNSARVTFGLPNEEAGMVRMESKFIETLPETPVVGGKAA